MVDRRWFLRYAAAGVAALDLVLTSDMENLARRWLFPDQYKEEGLARYCDIAKSGKAYLRRIMQRMRHRVRELS